MNKMSKFLDDFCNFSFKNWAIAIKNLVPFDSIFSLIQPSRNPDFLVAINAAKFKEKEKGLASKTETKNLD